MLQPRSTSTRRRTSLSPPPVGAASSWRLALRDSISAARLKVRVPRYLHGSMLPAPTVRLEVAGTIGVARRGLRSDRRAASAVHVPVCHGLTAPRPAFVTRNAQAHDCFDVSELTRTQAATARQRARQLGAGNACGGSEI